MPLFKIHHITKYQYDLQVKESINEIRIIPYQCKEQEVLQQALTITGNPYVYTFTDYWGNTAGSFNLVTPHKELVIESKVLVRTTGPEEIEVNANTGFEELNKEVDSHLHMIELAKEDTIESQNSIDEIIKTVYDPAKSIAAIVKDTGEYVYNNFQYIKGITTTDTRVDEILDLKSGVCQAHVMLQILRTMKIPSRYVSGYICPNKNGMRGEGATHAWVEAWIPQYGWAGIDPTNNVWVTNKHVKLAVGRNFKDCTPMKGTFKGVGEQKLSVFVSVGYEDGKTFEDLNDVRLRRANGRSSRKFQEQSQQQ